MLASVRRRIARVRSSGRGPPLLVRFDSPDPYKAMTLEAHEFIRLFLLHVLPKGFHRIRH